MFEDLLAAIRDLFAHDTTLMAVVALSLCGSALFFLVMRIKATREAVSRRVSGQGEESADSATPTDAIRDRVDAVVVGLADNMWRAEKAETRVLRARLIQAGYYDKEALVWFFVLRVVMAVALGGATFAATTMFSPETTLSTAAIYTLVAMGIGLSAPSFMLDKRIRKLEAQHRTGFPDFMDLMVVCAQAGLSMEASINRIAAELSLGFPSLARNLEIAARELRGGKPLASAIESLAHRLGIEEAKSFSTLLQQSEELGSSLTQSLRTYSDDMRNKRLMKAEEKAYSLPAKLVVPLTLFVFPTLMVVLLLPVVVSVSGVKI